MRAVYERSSRPRHVVHAGAARVRFRWAQDPGCGADHYIHGGGSTVSTNSTYRTLGQHASDVEIQGDLTSVTLTKGICHLILCARGLERGQDLTATALSLDRLNGTAGYGHRPRRRRVAYSSLDPAVAAGSCRSRIRDHGRPSRAARHARCGPSLRTNHKRDHPGVYAATPSVRARFGSRSWSRPWVSYHVILGLMAAS